jgi:hypothetical protein
MNQQALVFIGLYIVAKLLVRWVWFKPEHLRPGFIRHFFVIRVVDFGAILCLSAAFFFQMINGNLVHALLTTVALLAYDLGLRSLFLWIEARRICAHSHKWTLKSAKRRLRRRARQESPF